MADIFYEALQVIYLTALLATCGYAWVVGGWPEREGATIHFVASLASLPATLVLGADGYRSGQLAVFAVDIVALAAFVRLALTSNRWWPLWVSGFHLDAVMTHVAKIAAPNALPVGYALLQGFWAYPLMIALTFGAISHRQRNTDPMGQSD